MLLGIAPQAVADLRVEHFGEALREAVGERLQQDVVIIVDRLLEPLEMRLEPVDADREAADPVLALGIDEIGEAHVEAAFALLHLLAKAWQASPVVAGEHEHVVAFALAAPQADGRLRRDPAFGDELIEHRLRVLEQAARAFADDGVVEDRGIGARQLPGAEEGRPVDRRLQVLERPVAEMVEAGILRRRRLARGIVGEARWRALPRGSTSSLWPLRSRDLRSLS